MKTATNIGVIALLTAATAVEALSLAEMASYPYFPDSLTFARVDAFASGVLAPFSAPFLVLLLYSWPFRLAISLPFEFSRRLKANLTQFARSLGEWKPKLTANWSMASMADHSSLLLILAIAGSALLGIVPYRPDLNPSMIPLGVDAHFYVESVNQMLQRDPAAALSYAMGNSWAGSRPLIVIPMYLVAASGLASANQIVEALPAFLGPLLAVSTFFFVREGKGQKVASFASLFSVFSFNTTVGLWAGFYTNWLALAEAFLFLGLLLKFLKTSSKSKILLMAILSVFIILTHPWTWVVLLGVSTVFVISVWKDDRKRILLTAITSMLAVSLAVDIVKGLAFGGPVAVQDASISLSQSSSFLSLDLWQNILNGLFTAYEGLFGNALLMGLPLVVISLLRFRDKFDRLLIIWVALASVPFLFAGSLLQTRILYDLPLAILSGMGLLSLTQWMGGDTWRAKLIFLLVLLICANYTLRAVTSLVAVPF